MSALYIPPSDEYVPEVASMTKDRMKSQRRFNFGSTPLLKRRRQVCPHQAFRIFLFCCCWRLFPLKRCVFCHQHRFNSFQPQVNQAQQQASLDRQRHDAHMRLIELQIQVTTDEHNATMQLIRKQTEMYHLKCQLLKDELLRSATKNASTAAAHIAQDDFWTAQIINPITRFCWNIAVDDELFHCRAVWFWIFLRPAPEMPFAQ